MQPFRRDSQLRRRLEGFPAVAAPTFKRLVRLFASILHLRARDEDDIATLRGLRMER